MPTQTDIDQLYRLPLDEFTAARNALAKGAKNAAEIKGLAKPPLAAWAVNQLYWQDRPTWDALIDAAENLRRTHKTVLGGKGGDVRAAGAAHDAAVQDATKATLALLDNAATDAVKQAVVNTLRALPGDEPPGRLTRVLQPGGFEMLAGFSIAARAPAAHEKPAAKAGKTPHDKPAAGGKAERSKADTRALTQAREAAAAASHALREAEQSVRRHEFEIARATRDEERGEKAVEQAQAALAEAKAALAATERDRADARKRRTAAEAALEEAKDAVVAARKQADAAAAALKKVQAG